MFRIVKKERLNPTVTKMVIDAPFIAKKAEPGQFIILRALEDSERIPLTIADYDRQGGTVTIIYQIVGGSTMELDTLEEGQTLHDFVGPLGVATHTEGLKKVAVVGGGVGCAIALPVTKKLHEQGCEVHAIVGFRNKDLVILEDEFKAASDTLVMMTDDGSHGEKGLVTAALERLIQAGNAYDEVIAIGPLVMMKFVCAVTKKYGIKTVVSMNPIMIDGTGMCGGCRVKVGDEYLHACVDGPDFDGPDADGGPLHEAAADPETPDTGLHLFTVRGVVAFLVLFGWGGLWLHQVGLPGFLAVFLAIPIGFAGMMGIALAVRQALRLQYDGTLDLRNALGRTGTVYLTVPPGRSSPGKVTLTVQEQLTEFEALTDSPAPIPTGSPVRVTGLAGRGALLVEPIPSESEETE